MKVGIIGTGHLGKIHIKVVSQIPEFKLIGFFDNNKDVAKNISDEFNIKSYDNAEDLIIESDAIINVTPTTSHYEYTVFAIKNSKHVFIEKPITNTVEEAASLMKLANEANVKIQVGHVERFNPAFIEAKKYISNPMFIESHRLSGFHARGTDVSIVLDLMIHDIDLVLSLIKSNIKKVSANGVAGISNNIDIANARLEFDNGCVANITASRLSFENQRRMRIFQDNSYLTVDYLNKTSRIINVVDNKETDIKNENLIFKEEGAQFGKALFVKDLKTIENNAIMEELKSFHNSIVNDTTPIVSVEDGYKALEVAHLILDKIQMSSHV